MSKNKRLHEGSVALKKIVEKVPQLASEIESITFENAPCLRVRSYRALVRVVGYFKYHAGTHLLYRGQTACFGKMKASLYRRTPPPTDVDIESFLQRFRATFDFDRGPKAQLSTEPLLQHYGLETRWLDAVDSLPHALFFASHELCDSSQVNGSRTFVPSLREYGFIYMLDVGHLRPIQRNKVAVIGYSRTSLGLHLADLRALKPSSALRPHAQHGLLVRAASDAPDLWPHLVARVAVPTKEARAWISGEAMDREALFPPPVWDNFYGKVLSEKMKAFLKDEISRGNSWGDVLRFDFSK